MSKRQWYRPVFCRALTAIVVAFCSCALAASQTDFLQVAPNVSNSLLETRVEPIYPPIAKAAHVTGSVKIEFTVTPQGDVVSPKVLSGPPMLQQATLDAVKQWKFKPYLLNGAPTAIRTSTEVWFGNGPMSDADRKEADINHQVSPLMIQCNQLLQKRDQQSVEVCGQEVKLVDQYPPGRRQLDILTAHDQYGIALLSYDHNPQKALEQFEKEVSLLPGALTVTDAEYGWAYWHRGVAYAQLGDYAKAEQDYSVAEDSVSQAEKHLPSMAEQYEQNRKKIIAMHAALLRQEGKEAEAKKLEATSSP